MKLLPVTVNVRVLPIIPLHHRETVPEVAGVTVTLLVSGVSLAGNVEVTAVRCPHRAPIFLEVAGPGE